MIVRKIQNDELYHHGVQGQKWGVKHGPPYPLDSSVSTGERLRAQKNVNKLVNKKYSSKQQASEDVAKKLSKNVRKEDIKKLIRLKHDWYNSNAPDFYESKECEQAHKEAYDKTISFFEKNYPEDLKKWKKDSPDLFMVHDFRKTLEGYEDETFDKYEKLFKKRVKSKTEDQYFKEYMDACKKYVDDLVGEEKYSIFNRTFKNADRRVDFNDNTGSLSVHNVVHLAIDELEDHYDKYFKDDVIRYR